MQTVGGVVQARRALTHFQRSEEDMPTACFEFEMMLQVTSVSDGTSTSASCLRVL